MTEQKHTPGPWPADRELTIDSVCHWPSTGYRESVTYPDGRIALSLNTLSLLPDEALRLHEQLGEALRSMAASTGKSRYVPGPPGVDTIDADALATGLQEAVLEHAKKRQAVLRHSEPAFAVGYLASLAVALAVKADGGLERILSTIKEYHPYPRAAIAKAAGDAGDNEETP